MLLKHRRWHLSLTDGVEIEKNSLEHRIISARGILSCRPKILADSNNFIRCKDSYKIPNNKGKE